jgi:putative FmdB family regulatory protein
MQGAPEFAEVPMPFYEYECQACGVHHEAMQKMSEAPLKQCPECGKPQLVRLISAPVFRLKGGGWYETDFKSDKEKKRNLAGGEDKPAGDSDSSTRRKAAKKADAAAVKPKAAPKPEKTGIAAKSAAKTKTKTKAKAKAKAKVKVKTKTKAAAPSKAKVALKSKAKVAVPAKKKATKPKSATRSPRKP